MNKICVGLDLKHTSSFHDYEKIIMETKDLAYCYKINPAFFLGDSKKIFELSKFLNKNNLKWIYDSKVGDVHHTNEKYAKYIYDVLGATGTTINPYLGLKPLNEFKKYKDKENYIVCITSNEGADLFQKSSYRCILNIAKNFGFDLVIAGNKENYLKEAVNYCPKSKILSPGIGAQGGEIKINSDNIIYNISRSIINDKNPREKLKEFI